MVNIFPPIPDPTDWLREQGVGFQKRVNQRPSINMPFSQGAPVFDMFSFLEDVRQRSLSQDQAREQNRPGREETQKVPDPVQMGQPPGRTVAQQNIDSARGKGPDRPLGEAIHEGLQNIQGVPTETPSPLTQRGSRDEISAWIDTLNTKEFDKGRKSPTAAANVVLQNSGIEVSNQVRKQFLANAGKVIEGFNQANPHESGQRNLTAYYDTLTQYLVALQQAEQEANNPQTQTTESGEEAPPQSQFQGQDRTYQYDPASGRIKPIAGAQTIPPELAKQLQLVQDIQTAPNPLRNPSDFFRMETSADEVWDIINLLRKGG